MPNRIFIIIIDIAYSNIWKNNVSVANEMHILNLFQDLVILNFQINLELYLSTPH